MTLPLETNARQPALPYGSRVLKRGLDLAVAIAIAPLVLPLMIVVAIGARASTGKPFFVQTRVGLWGEPFKVYKICSMRAEAEHSTNVTTTNDARITPFGRFIRRAKLDELPQLWNVLRGEMSFVGPRPDVSEVYENLPRGDEIVLCLKPGITGLASVVYRDEEVQLAEVDDPEAVYRDVVFPNKIKINKTYIANYTLLLDIKIMIASIVPFGFKDHHHD